MPCAPRPLILFGGRTSVALHHTFAIGCQPGIVVRNFGRELQRQFKVEEDEHATLYDDSQMQIYIYKTMLRDYERERRRDLLEYEEKKRKEMYNVQELWTNYQSKKKRVCPHPEIA